MRTVCIMGLVGLVAATCHGQEDIAALQQKGYAALSKTPLAVTYTVRLATEGTTESIHQEEVLVDDTKRLVRSTASGKFSMTAVYDGQRTKMMTEMISARTGKSSREGSEIEGEGVLPYHLNVFLPYLWKKGDLAKMTMTTDTAAGRLIARAHSANREVEAAFDLRHGGMLLSDRYANGRFAKEHTFSDPIEFNGVYLPTRVSLREYDASGNPRKVVEFFDIQYSVLNEQDRARAFHMEFPAGTEMNRNRLSPPLSRKRDHVGAN